MCLTCFLCWKKSNYHIEMTLKQPPAVKLCTHISPRSEAQTFNRRNNKKNIFFEWRAALNSKLTSDSLTFHPDCRDVLQGLVTWMLQVLTRGDEANLRLHPTVLLMGLVREMIWYNPVQQHIEQS